MCDGIMARLVEHFHLSNGPYCTCAGGLCSPIQHNMFAGCGRFDMRASERGRLGAFAPYARAPVCRILCVSWSSECELASHGADDREVFVCVCVRSLDCELLLLTM